MSKVTFGKFEGPKDDASKAIFVDGVEVGFIERSMVADGWLDQHLTVGEYIVNVFDGPEAGGPMLHLEGRSFAKLPACLAAIKAAYVTPPCAASMGCLCAGHARGALATAPCDTTEVRS